MNDLENEEVLRKNLQRILLINKSNKTFHHAIINREAANLHIVPPISAFAQLRIGYIRMHNLNKENSNINSWL